MKKLLTSMFIMTSCMFGLNLGEIPKEITISGTNGSTADGKAWHSKMLKDKVYVLIYADPDKKGDNDTFLDALDKKDYDKDRYGLIAIINLKATWLPSFAIEKKLKDKQKEFPHITYVNDKTKYLVKKWGLADDASNILIFDKKGKLIYQHIGLMKRDDIQKAFLLIENNINK